MHKFTIEEYQTFIKIIEEEFGLYWLKKKVKQANDRGIWGKHPIPKYWKEAIDTLEEFNNTGVLNINQGLIALSTFAYHLCKSRLLPNYDIAIRPRLKKPEFSKVQYEVYVGGLCVRAGYQVEFIALPTTSGKRIADLKLLTKEGEIYLEATRKDDYNNANNDNQMWGTIWRTIANLQSKLKANHEVFIFPVGEAISQKHIGNILETLECNILNDKEGIWLNLEGNYGLALRKLPKPSRNEGQGLGVFIPAEMNPGFAFVTIGEDKKGRKYAENYNRVALYSINSHKLSSVLNTFNKKRQRKQIPTNGIGIIYINLDVSQVLDSDVITYLEFLKKLLETKFTVNANTRIGAIVLTTGPQFIESKVDGKPFITAHRRRMVIRNTFGLLPDDFVVP